MDVAEARRQRVMLFLEHAACTLLSAVLAYVLLAVFRDSSTVKAAWGGAAGAATFVLAIQTWLTIPLAVIVAVGWLMRRIRGLRQTGQDGPHEHGAKAWLSEYAAEAAIAALIGDLLLLWLYDLRDYGNTSWILYPWVIAALALGSIWFLRFVLISIVESRAAGSREGRASVIGELDWLGESLIAVVLSSFLVVPGLSWLTIGFTSDQLRNDLLPVHAAVLVAASIPLALMGFRRAAVWAWRWQTA